MNTFTRRRASIIGVVGFSAAVAAYAAPGAFAAGTVTGDVDISNTETVQVLMGADGKINAERVYEQLVLTGEGSVDIANPVSTEGLRNLDGFGGFDVRDGAARIKTDVDGTKKYRSVSDFTKELPISVEITYTLDGKKVRPSDIVGESGTLEVRYLVTNTTGKTEDVSFKDGTGSTQTASEDVVIPIVGSLTTVLPSSFTEVSSAEANAAGDGRGGTQMSFTMTLIPPIGATTAEFGYTAEVKDAVVPPASMSVLPVNPLESPSFKGGAASYAGGAQTGQDLTAGATEIDANVLQLADGASDLVDGLMQLRDGADQLSAGLNDTAVPGAGKLAAGAGDLDAGASKLKAGTGDLTAGANRLNAGAGDLADGLKDASAGGPALLQGVADLRAGAQKVDAGLVALNTTVSAGGAQFKSTFAGSVDTNTAAVASQLATSVNDALDNLNLLVAGSAATDVEKATFAGNVAATKTALNNGIAGALTGPLASGLKAGVNAGVDQLTTGVAGGVGDPASADTLRNGMAQILGGLDLLSDKGGELADGLQKLSAGANQLKSGTSDLTSGANQLNAGADDLKDGTSQLSAGAGQLSSGLNDAASGSAQLADGLNQAAGTAPALPEGAERLSDEGMSQLIAAGDATAVDFGLKYALIEAGAARAASAQPYGSPEGAMALSAFKFEIAGEDGAGSDNVKRGIAGIALLAGAGALAARRRGIFG